MSRHYSDLTYYDYADEVLTPENYKSFSDFVGRVFDFKKGNLCIFVGLGSNGKSTLLKKLTGAYPNIFTNQENSRCVPYSEMRESDHENILNYLEKTNVIVVVNRLSEIDGIHDTHPNNDTFVVGFQRKFA